jgi:hypothetical protein
MSSTVSGPPSASPGGRQRKVTDVVPAEGSKSSRTAAHPERLLVGPYLLGSGRAVVPVARGGSRGGSVMRTQLTRARMGREVLAQTFTKSRRA